MTKKERFNKIFPILENKFGKPKCALDFETPYQLMVAVILSAQCTDERVNIVTKELFKVVREPQDIRNMDIKVLEKYIKSTGFYKNKAKNIKLNAEAMRKLSLSKKETIVYIENIPRRCIVRDISYSGAKFIMAGIAPFLLNKDCVLKFDFDEPTVIVGLRGKIIRAELVEKRKDLIAVAMTYNASTVPLAYKIRLTQYFNQQRKIYP